MMSMVGIPDDRIDNITPKEYFGYLMSFSMRLGGVTIAKERPALIYKGVKLIDENRAIILLGNGNDMSDGELGELRIIKIGDKWYLTIVEDVEFAADVEVDETIDEVEVP